MCSGCDEHIGYLKGPTNIFNALGNKQKRKHHNCDAFEHAIGPKKTNNLLH
jgi:hypothetical protein